MEVRLAQNLAYPSMRARGGGIPYFLAIPKDYAIERCAVARLGGAVCVCVFVQDVCAATRAFSRHDLLRMFPFVFTMLHNRFFRLWPHVQVVSQRPRADQSSHIPGTELKPLALVAVAHEVRARCHDRRLGGSEQPCPPTEHTPTLLSMYTPLPLAGCTTSIVSSAGL